jgi:hypothetical protein
MKIQSLITEKVAELYLEARSGVRRPRRMRGARREGVAAGPLVHDSIIVTARANQGAMNKEAAEHLQKVKELQQQVLGKQHALNEKAAEEIARKILDTLM